MAVLRYSKQRESIKNYLCGREDHPTADMIYTSIREEYQSGNNISESFFISRDW